MFRVIPNVLSDKINEMLDKKLPEEAKKDREYFYNQLIGFYDEHGYLPNFTINKKKGK